MLYAYVLARALKAIMINLVLSSAKQDLKKRIMSLYLNDYKNPENPAILISSFDTITFFGPLTVICALFLPTVVYVFILNLKHSRKETKVGEQSVLFLYPIFTNIYFVKPKSQKSVNISRSAKTSTKPLKRSKSAPELTALLHKSVHRQRSISMYLLPWIDTECTQPEFSLFHSNVLYVLFFFPNLIRLGLELRLLIVNRGSYSPLLTMIVSALLCLNVILWLDFNRNWSKRKSNYEPNFSR